MSTSAERTYLVEQENRKVYIERQSTSAERTVYASED